MNQKRYFVIVLTYKWMIGDKYILLFDGACILCNGYVNWIISQDREDKIRFASQQSEIGLELVRYYDIPENLRTIALLTPDGKTLLYSSVPLEIFRIIGGWYRAALVFLVVPKFLRDAIYFFVARNRYKWFGKEEEACGLPPRHLRGKFLI